MRRMLTPDTPTYDALCDVMDEVQRARQMLARLCEQAGIDPAEASRLPDDPVPGVVKAA
ncbi:MAG TPA: hypothetical protein VGH54_28960 [Mycobacterium sp.]|uniref:hypothetical protein n=1 Tax=Mycobacterium sp. TaxID=1785 RepID=UPI002F406D78